MAQKPMAAKTKTKKSKTVTMTYKSGVFYFNTTTTTAHHPSQGMGRKREISRDFSMLLVSHKIKQTHCVIAVNDGFDQTAWRLQ